ncbi:MAG: alanine racemase [Erysipelotrichaceae bacterium]
MKYSVENIIDNYSTPAYIFDMEVLQERVNYLNKILDNKAQICYAIKANPFVAKYLKDSIEKFEVCSPGELYICNDYEIAGKKIVVSGVHKEEQVMEYALNHYDGINIFTIESLSQYELLDELCHKYDKKINLLVRLSSKTQFGVSEEDLWTIIDKAVDNPYLNVQGIQHYSSTQKKSIKRLTKEINQLDELIQEINEKYPETIKELEYGPGFPIFYFNNDEFDEDEFLLEFKNILGSITSSVSVTLEIGRSLVASCGNYITKVVDLKNIGELNYAIVDGGIHHIAYFGQFMATKIPFIDIYPPRNCEDGKMWNICGSLCTNNDILVKELQIEDLKINDYLVFKNTGAYCMCEGISLFLSRDLPQVIIYSQENGYEIARDKQAIYNLNKCQ